MTLPSDHKEAVSRLSEVVPYEALRDLTNELPKWDFSSRQPEIEAAKRAAFEILHDCRAALQRVMDDVAPRLAERIAQERRENEPFSGPCRDWPAQVAGMTSDEIESALGARKLMEERF